MEQKDLDLIKKFEEIKEKRGLRVIGFLVLVGLGCCPIFILFDVIKNGTVEVTLPYLFEKFSFGCFLAFIMCSVSYINMWRKYKKLKEKE